MKSVMQNRFAQVPRAQISRSVFDTSRGRKTTMDSGYLVPIMVQEILPGDDITISPTLFARLATPLFPIMDNMYAETFTFFVPNRLVWENWERFCGARTDPADSIDYEIPQVTPPAGGWQEQTLGGYMGLPLDNENAVSSLPFRMYNLIWNEWFRDQNLQDSLTVPTTDGPDTYTGLFSLKKVNKQHDYFTSCLPSPQKGDAIDLPIGSQAPVIGNGMALGLTDGTYDFGIDTNASIGSPPYYITGNQSNFGDDVGDASGAAGSIYGQRAMGVTDDPDNSGLIADLSEAVAATINELRQAFQLQRMAERDARSGTRYVELLAAHFGVTSPDFRLQRPEYLGGGKLHVNISPVQQTAEGTDPVGKLAATGLFSGNCGNVRKSFVEHGYVITLLTVRGDLTYQQGIERHWSRLTREDFYWPALANLGEQPVYNKEIYAQGTSADDEVFGYQERWAEYRYGQSLITGALRSTASTPLDSWHIAEEFGSLPSLSSSFIESNLNGTLDRCLAVTSEPQWIVDCYFKVKHARPMPVYSVPGMIDHF